MIIFKNGNSYEYDAFENQKSGTGTWNNSNPIRYCGEYYDKESGLIYLRARYYDSEEGRFLSEDPAKDGYNWYIYCGGNPVMFVDPSGLDFAFIEDSNAVNLGVTNAGHMSALIDDENGNWWYFYYGNNAGGVPVGDGKVIMVKIPKTYTVQSGESAGVVIDPMGDLGNLNIWLNETGIYNGTYDNSTYVKGDFSYSVSYIKRLIENPGKYNAVNNQCADQALIAFSMGLINYNGWDIQFFNERYTEKLKQVLMPKNTIKYLKRIFNNSAVNRAGYEQQGGYMRYDIVW